MEVAVALWEAQQHKHHRCSSHLWLRDHGRCHKACHLLGLVEFHRNNRGKTRGLLWTL